MDGKNKVICVSSYAGKNVKGYAKCSDSDVFDLEKGKKIAQARVDVKIADKKCKRAQQKFADANVAFGDAATKLDKMRSYVLDSLNELEAAKNNLADIERNI